jgi:DNA-binding HxlR family transcriptional regulator
VARPGALWRNREREPEAARPQDRTQARSSQSSAGRLSSRQTRPIEPVVLDRLIHERMRLGMVSALAVNESLSFNDLKKLLDATDGNLSVHARKLEEAQYITCKKFFAGRLPKTEYRLTPAGRKALETYLDQMEALIRATRERLD